MNNLRSFEETKGGKSGDLLSKKHGDSKPTVGFLGCAYFEYWRMYKDLREQVAGDMDTIARHLRRKYHVVYPGLVETLDG
ncbi:MAG: hypothetical protein Q8N81_00645, partial [bacterium]|nr:hypothetical protein [bacterium]